jgi:predicted AlkP superfamily pyrophosphatase or phosphodiesterase
MENGNGTIHTGSYPPEIGSRNSHEGNAVESQEFRIGSPLMPRPLSKWNTIPAAVHRLVRSKPSEGESSKRHHLDLLNYHGNRNPDLPAFAD